MSRFTLDITRYVNASTPHATTSELQSLSYVLLLQPKNVTPYVQNALKLSNETENSTITFCHNNSYHKNELNECFSRNSEGMLKNMAIHVSVELTRYYIC